MCSYGKRHREAVNLITYARLGRLRNLKTDAILPALEELRASGLMKQTICQSATDFGGGRCVSALPLPIHYLLAVAGAVGMPQKLSRRIEESIFDIHASLRLRRARIALFHPARFRLTMRRARELDSLSIGIGTVPHPGVEEPMYAEEYRRLGLAFAGMKGFASAETVRHFDHIIALSDFVRTSYITGGFAEDRVHVASLDVDTNRFQPMRKADDIFRVVFLSVINIRKGLHYLLEAWDQLNLPNSELLIVGKMKVPAPLERLYLKQIRDDPSIRWIEGTKAPERIYPQGSVFVFPSLAEGFGKVTAEAMACGLPVITTRNAAGLVTDGYDGFVISERDVTTLQSRIEKLYFDSEMRTAMGERARKTVLEKEGFGARVVEICRSLLQQ